MTLTEGKPNSEQNLSQCHLAHCNAHADWLGIEYGPLWWQTGNYPHQPRCSPSVYDDGAHQYTSFQIFHCFYHWMFSSYVRPTFSTMNTILLWTDL